MPSSWLLWAPKNFFICVVDVQNIGDGGIMVINWRSLLQLVGAGQSGGSALDWTGLD